MMTTLLVEAAPVLCTSAMTVVSAAYFGRYCYRGAKTEDDVLGDFIGYEQVPCCDDLPAHALIIASSLRWVMRKTNWKTKWMITGKQEQE